MSVILCINGMYLYLHGEGGGGRVVSLPFTPQQSSNHPSIMHLMKGYHAEPFLKHSGKKTKQKQNNLCSPREKWSKLLSVSDNLVVEGQLRLLSTPGHNDTALCDKPLKPMSETR